METERDTLDAINSEDKVNEAISRDEESNMDSNPFTLAEDLIKQLPESHQGRNYWLRTFGKSEEAKRIREKFSALSNR